MSPKYVRRRRRSGKRRRAMKNRQPQGPEGGKAVQVPFPFKIIFKNFNFPIITLKTYFMQLLFQLFKYSSRVKCSYGDWCGGKWKRQQKGNWSTILFTVTFIQQTLERNGGNYQLIIVERYRLMFKPCSQTPNHFALSSPGLSSSNVVCSRNTSQQGKGRWWCVCCVWGPLKGSKGTCLELGDVGVGVLPRKKTGLFRVRHPVCLVCKYVWWLSSRDLWRVYSAREPFWNSMKNAAR